MDLIAGLTGLNYLAIFVAVVVAHVAGMIFFSPKMLGKKRMESLGMTEEEMKNGQCRQTMAVSFGTVYVIGIIMAILFGGAGMKTGLVMGLVLSLGIVVMSKAMHASYNNMNKTLFLIESAYDILFFVIMGAIIGAW